jgi:hypothetical protein
MSTSALRPRSVTEIVDAAFQILRAHYAQFVMCSAIAYVPWLIVELLVVGDLTHPPALGTTLLTFLGAWVSFALMSAVIVSCASQAYLGEPVDVAAAVRRTGSRLPSILAAAGIRYVMVVVGLVAFLVGALYVVARFFAVVPVILLEDAGPLHALARSSELSDGRKWHVLNTLGLVGVIYWVLAMGVGLVALIPGNFSVQIGASALFTILAYPVIAITEALVYYDARIRSEGLDIELMVGALDGPTQEAASP